MNDHRKDIDGLRAIAVSSVVLYHCGFARFLPGGFVGVDIFIVISGFLITGIVQRSIDDKKFSILDFYGRRICRIFPALFVVYIFVAASSFSLLFIPDARQNGSNIISSVLFISNIYFYYTSGYFEAASEINPLLHTWSLSVEEQFYIFLPLALFFLRFVPRPTLTALLFVTAICSLIASIFVLSRDQSAAFYFVQYRAWELAIGSILAVHTSSMVLPGKAREAAAALGLALIAGSLFFITAEMPFPGLLALPVCLGTALLLFSGSQGPTLVGRFLALPPMQIVGLSSYSFYLWHWPIWVMGAQIYDIRPVGMRLAAIVVSFVLALLSWQFIEKPFRFGKKRSPQVTIISGVAAMCAIAIVGISLGTVTATYWKYPKHIEEIASFTNYKAGESFRMGTCFLTAHSTDFKLFRKDTCLQRSETKPNYLLIGDSHAAHAYAGLSQYPEINVMQATASGCLPVSNTSGEKFCTELVHYIFDNYLPHNRVDTIILAGRWKESDFWGLRNTVVYLQKFASSVVVLGPVAEYDIPLPRILANAEYSGDAHLPGKHLQEEPFRLDLKLRELLNDGRTIYVSLAETLCPDRKCTTLAEDGTPVQFDYGHMTASGSRLVIARARKQIFGNIFH